MSNEEIYLLVEEAEQYEIAGKYVEAESVSRSLIHLLFNNDNLVCNRCQSLLCLSRSLWRQGMTEDALRFAHEACNGLILLHNNELLSKLFGHLGNLYSDKSDFHLALENYRKAITINEEFGNVEETAKNLGNMGLAYAELSDYLQALKYYQRALELNEKLGRSSGIATNLGNIGLMYWNLSDLPLALTYYTKSLSIHEELQSISGTAITVSNIGSVYFNMIDYPKAQEYLQRALTLFESIGDKYGIAANLSNLGTIYAELSDFRKGIEYLEIALTINRELQNKSGEAIALGNIGRILANRDFDGFNATKAEEYLIDAIHLCNEIGIKKEQYEFYFFLSELLATLERWQEAFDCHTKYHLLEKQVHSEEIEKQSQRYAIEREVAVMQREQEVMYIKNNELAAINAKLEVSNHQLIELNIEKNEFLGIAAHDLKNPLSAITMIASILKDEAMKISPIEVKDFARDIHTSSKQMFDLIVNLLDVNKIEQGNVLPDIEQFALHECTEVIVERYREAALRKGIAVTWNIEDIEIQSSRTVVLQIVDNLVSNALKFSQTDANIFIDAIMIKPNQLIRISVKDEGPGLTEDDKRKLFGKFTQLSAKPTAGEHSSGLGLSIVKRLVEMVNGRIWCESELGKGATFIVELPMKYIDVAR